MRGRDSAGKVVGNLAGDKQHLHSFLNTLRYAALCRKSIHHCFPRVLKLEQWMGDQFSTLLFMVSSLNHTSVKSARLRIDIDRT